MVAPFSKFYGKICVDFYFLQVFNTLSLKQIFWKTKFFFKKLKYRFLVESTKTEHASFPYKNDILEAHVKRNRMVSTKLAYHKERSFDSNHFIFLKTSFQFKNLLQGDDLMYQRLKCPYSYIL